MRKKILFSGYCPTTKDENEVYISYIDATAKEDTKRVYIKGANLCSVDCNEKCPIWENAPQQI